MRVIVRSSGYILVSNLTVADSAISRLIGLLGKSSLSKDSGLWLKPCKGVHTFGMRFPIDIVFLDVKQRVVAIHHQLRPNRMTKFYSEAVSVIELSPPSASDANLSIGDILDIEM